MSCAGKGYGTNPQSDAYLSAQFFSSIVTTSVRPQTSRKCRQFKGFYPSFTPILSDLSITSSAQNTYSNVYVYGSNFLPNRITFIKFGNLGYYPVIYYSSSELSFIVPENASPGNYNVQVVNLYNSNFSPPVNQSYPGNLNFSNSITYTIT
jgi:hypothetical protein